MKWLDQSYSVEILREMERICPEHVQNDFGTKIINKSHAAIYRHIAHLRILSQWSAVLHAGAFAIALMALWRTL